MKTLAHTLAILAASMVALASSARAQLAIPSDGSDGALNLTSGKNVIDLLHAFSGVWSNNNATNAGKGIYDPVKWAVVFKYSSVVIASNASVVFINDISRAPVVWLDSGDVTINGTVNLDGQNETWDPYNLPEPGHGGFKGGAMPQQNPRYGPGGNSYVRNGASSGGFFASGPAPYGNAQMVLLIGG
jgi:hypothetical protein